jgi:hypothetical protein
MFSLLLQFKAQIILFFTSLVSLFIGSTIAKNKALKNQNKALENEIIENNEEAVHVVKNLQQQALESTDAYLDDDAVLNWMYGHNTANKACEFKGDGCA